MPTAPPNHNRKSSTRKHQTSWGKGRGGRPWRRKRETVFKRDNYMCQICLLGGTYTAIELTGPNAGVCDHITPLSKGGTDEIKNLQAICKRCDAMKTHRESRGGGQ